MNWQEGLEFDKYKYWLGKYIPENMQNEAMEYFMTCDEDLLPYILSYDNAINWDCAIKVLNRMGYPKNKKAIGSVMCVLRDINLPIADTAFQILVDNYNHDSKNVVQEMEKIIIKAQHINDPDWLWGLCCAIEILGINKSDFSSEKFWDLLSTCGYWKE